MKNVYNSLLNQAELAGKKNGKRYESKFNQVFNDSMKYVSSLSDNQLSELKNTYNGAFDSYLKNTQGRKTKTRENIENKVKTLDSLLSDKSNIDICKELNNEMKNSRRYSDKFEKAYELISTKTDNGSLSDSQAKFAKEYVNNLVNDYKTKNKGKVTKNYLDKINTSMNGINSVLNSYINNQQSNLKSDVSDNLGDNPSNYNTNERFFIPHDNGIILHGVTIIPPIKYVTQPAKDAVSFAAQGIKSIGDLIGLTYHNVKNNLKDKKSKIANKIKNIYSKKSDVEIELDPNKPGSAMMNPLPKPNQDLKKEKDYTIDGVLNDGSVESREENVKESLFSKFKNWYNSKKVDTKKSDVNVKDEEKQATYFSKIKGRLLNFKEKSPIYKLFSGKNKTDKKIIGQEENTNVQNKNSWKRQVAYTTLGVASLAALSIGAYAAFNKEAVDETKEEKPASVYAINSKDITPSVIDVDKNSKENTLEGVIEKINNLTFTQPKQVDPKSSEFDEKLKTQWYGLHIEKDQENKTFIPTLSKDIDDDNLSLIGQLKDGGFKVLNPGDSYSSNEFSAVGFAKVNNNDDVNFRNSVRLDKESKKSEQVMPLEEKTIEEDEKKSTNSSNNDEVVDFLKGQSDILLKN
ncbi:MAG: hypothetical protein ACLFPJ_02655 [Candidatus Woesearchaeota archaeon]